jgi:hypothetical protein
LFAGVRPEQQAIGEASVWYLHSAHALERVKAEHPNIRLIVMLRNPVDFLRSLHSDMVWICFEDEPDFEAAWRLSQLRSGGERIPALCQVPWFLDYRSVGQLGKHVARMLRLFPREQVKLLLLDDLRDRPQQTYEETLSFLGLQNDRRRDFPAVNASKQNRSQWVAACRAAVIRSLPRPVVNFGKKFGLGHVSHAVMRLNSRPASMRLLRPEFRRELQEVFREDVQLLGELVGRDLNHWLAASP